MIRRCAEKKIVAIFSSYVILSLCLIHILKLCPLHISRRHFYIPVKRRVVLCPDFVRPSVCLLTCRVCPCFHKNGLKNFCETGQMFTIARWCTELIPEHFPMKIKVTSSNGNVSYLLCNYKTSKISSLCTDKKEQ